MTLPAVTMFVMPGALRESLIGPPPGPSVDPPTWVLPQDLVGCVACDTTVDLLEVCRAVTEWLFQLSGRRYKQRRVMVRPTLNAGACGWQLGWLGEWGMTPASFEAWVLADEYALQLAAPVQQIIAVRVDGQDLDPGNVTLVDGRYLFRLDNNGNRMPWPISQRPEASDNLPGTCSILYAWGQPVPAGGTIAARAWACWLASQLAKLTGGGDCAIPDRVTQLVTQGVTLSRLSAFDFLESGKTGVDLVDTWINTVNPNGLRRPATIVSPDSVRGLTV